jgi:hypothetical protein
LEVPNFRVRDSSVESLNTMLSHLGLTSTHGLIHSNDYTFLHPYPTQKESKVVFYIVFYFILFFIIKFGWVFVFELDLFLVFD